VRGLDDIDRPERAHRRRTNLQGPARRTLAPYVERDPATNEVVNACDRRLVVRLWETPTPGGDSADDPEQVEVPPLDVAVARDALADVGDDGSAAEIVSGPGEGEVLFIPHGDRTVIIPAGLCG
jgi:hypothetical protein